MRELLQTAVLLESLPMQEDFVSDGLKQIQSCFILPKWFKVVGVQERGAYSSVNFLFQKISLHAYAQKNLVTLFFTEQYPLRENIVGN